MAAGPELVQIKGLAELEAGLKKLREEMKVKTGGVIVRGLRAGAKLIANEAKSRVPEVPSNYGPRFALEHAKQRKGKAALGYKSYLKGATRGPKVRVIDNKRLKAMLKSSIVQYAIPSDSPLAGGKPAVVIRVSGAGYTRIGKSIRFNRPGSKPSWWWWLEFGTSKRPATPFLRPAFAARNKDAAEAARDRIKKEIADTLAKNIKRVRR